MRRKLFAGNWKMNVLPVEARNLIAQLRGRLDPLAQQLARDRDILLAPAFPALSAAAQALAGADIGLCAQNMHYEDKGAFTGEVSPPMLKALGVRWVILGHSERRRLLGESDELINRKVHAALRHKLRVILCVGESAEERDSGATLNVVLRQLNAGLADVREAGLLSIAYEPVWAIGTGRNATPEQAQNVHGVIRETLRDRFGREHGDSIRILYGGSVTPDNIDSLIAKPDIDGALVGGASLNAESFSRIACSGI